jgi:hypothetical protein
MTPTTAAAIKPAISPHSEHSIFNGPRPQILRATGTASVSRATDRSGTYDGRNWFCTSRNCPTPRVPSCRPTMKTERPLTTGVITMRSRLRSSAISISAAPAITVIPNISSMPPAWTASIDGAKKVAE